MEGLQASGMRMSSIRSQGRDLTRSKRDGQILRFDAAQPGQQRVLTTLLDLKVVLRKSIDGVLFLDGHKYESCGRTV
jgi:hypothetical protein